MTKPPTTTIKKGMRIPFRGTWATVISVWPSKGKCDLLDDGDHYPYTYRLDVLERHLAKMKKGLADAKEGKLHDLGDFSQYANDEI